MPHESRVEPRQCRQPGGMQIAHLLLIMRLKRNHAAIAR